MIDHPDIANEQFPETAHGLRAKKEIDHFDITNELNQFPETKREMARGLGAKKRLIILISQMNSFQKHLVVFVPKRRLIILISQMNLISFQKLKGRRFMAFVPTVSSIYQKSFVSYWKN